MKKLGLFALLLTVVYVSSAQEAPKDSLPPDSSNWKTSGVATLNFSQLSLTNWAAGGASSIALNGYLSVAAGYKKNLITWDNNLDLGYGILKQNGNPFFKSDDNIELNSKLGRNVGRKNGPWSYAALINFKSQFAPGYKNIGDTVRISNLLAPGYAIGSIGIDYKPSKKFTAYLSAVTSKTTFVLDQPLADKGAYGVEAATYDSLGRRVTLGQRIRYEIGGYFRLFYKDEIFKNVTLQTKLDLFSNYLHNPQNIDINWETLIALKVNSHITTTFLTHIIYDDDIKIGVDTNDDGVDDKFGPRTQLKQQLGVGFSYKF